MFGALQGHLEAHYAARRAARLRAEHLARHGVALRCPWCRQVGNNTEHALTPSFADPSRYRLVCDVCEGGSLWDFNAAPVPVLWRALNAPEPASPGYAPAPPPPKEPLVLADPLPEGPEAQPEGAQECPPQAALDLPDPMALWSVGFATAALAYLLAGDSLPWMAMFGVAVAYSLLSLLHFAQRVRGMLADDAKEYDQ